MRRLLPTASSLGLAWLSLVLAVGARGQSVRISEVQTSNGGTLYDEDGDTPDWIELENAGAVPVDLIGCGLSDAADNPFKWIFGSGATLSAKGFLVVFASGKDRQPEPTAAVPPSSLPGLVLWLRADTVDPAAPTEVRLAGDTIFLRWWRDLSGANNHADQSTENLQPQWFAAGQGSFAALRFDGANDLLRLRRPVGTNDWCLLAVCRTSQAHEVDPESTAGVGGVSGQRWLFGAAHGGDLDAGAGLSLGKNGVSVYEHGANYMPALAVTTPPLGTNLVVLAVNYTARQPTIELQGLSAHAGLISPRRQVWAPVEIGSGAYGAFGGDVLEVVGFSRTLSAEERRDLAAYLVDRYSVSRSDPRHTNFELKSSGEEVLLTRADGTELDRVTFGAVPRDVSYGRSPGQPEQWLFFADPTPGASNSAPGSTEWLAPPTFSHEGGFHSNTFYLTLATTNVGAEIRYTLSGSEPTTNAQLYAGPVLIRSREGTPNDLSAIPTVPGGAPPLGEVFKGWVVRARVFKPGALPSTTVTRTYWVHPHGRARYSLPLVSLATDRKNFFDPTIGIYVPGEAPGGNYSQRGPEWERPVHIELYEPDNSLAFAHDGDVKIHGNTSQNFPIKGLDLDATSGSGRQPFRYRIFPDRKRSEFEHFLLRPSGHDFYLALMRDEMTQALASETGAETQAARPAVVFLNGEYWGVHYLKEKEDNEFVSFYGDVPSEALDYLEGYAIARTGDTLHYDAMLRFVATNDPAQAGTFGRIQQLLDVPNYIDYKVWEVFNYRWDIGNHRLWRPRTPEGRWRWLQFDNDVSWGGFGALAPAWNYDMLAADLSPDGRLHDGHNNETTTFLLRRLMLNETFQREFINRFADLLNTTLLPSNTLAQIGRLAALLAPEIVEHSARWRAPASYADWQNAVAALRQFGQLRPDACRQHLQQQFHLPGMVRVTVQLNGSGANAVRLNTLKISDTGSTGWQGLYFQGLALPVRAEPAFGQRFVRWIGPVQSPAPQTVLQPATDGTLTAVFTGAAATTPHVELARPPPGQFLEIRCLTDSLQTVGLESSTDLQHWHEESWVVSDSHGLAVFTVSFAPGVGREFFRVRLP